MTAKEIEIIDAIKEIPDCNNFGYKFESDLLITIATVMGYKINTQYRFGGVYRTIANPEDKEKVMKIKKGLKENNIIRLSKTGTTFKVLKEE